MLAVGLKSWAPPECRGVIGLNTSHRTPKSTVSRLNRVRLSPAQPLYQVCRAVGVVTNCVLPNVFGVPRRNDAHELANALLVESTGLLVASNVAPGPN